MGCNEYAQVAAFDRFPYCGGQNADPTWMKSIVKLFHNNTRTFLDCLQGRQNSERSQGAI